MDSKKCCIVLTTTDSKKKANLIAKTLLEAKLAACVQIDKVESFFYYEASYRQTNEFRLMIKAPHDNYHAIEKSIRFIHNYHLPQIIKLDIANGVPEYLEWVCRK